VTTNLWQEAGFSAVLFATAIAGVDENLYEAARIDGANRWQQTIRITLGCLKPFIILLLVLNISNILNAGFEQIFNLYNSTIYRTADVIETYVYRVGLQEAQYSFATAVGLFKSVISCILIGMSYRLAYKLANYRIF
jgi:putative aldouronate transport system permease protein